MVNIYVLKLKSGKYYVGKTNNVNVRLNDHIRSKGSTWTKKYKPISVEHVFKNCDNLDEDKYTLKLMSEKGIDNVRGGSFCKIKLNQASKEIIQRMLRSKDDKCHFCGEAGHFIRNCSTKALVKMNLDEFESEEESEEEYEEEYEEESEVWFCSYCNKEFDTKKGATFHENVHCKVRNRRKPKKSSSRRNSIWCYRCGRDGHKSTSCYAKRDIDGDYI